MTPARILIVEDEGAIALDIQNQLEREGYQVCATVPSGEDAIQKAAEEHPDLILMDIHLAGKMDGVEAAQHIRDHFHIPVVYLTAFSDAGTLQRAKTTQPFGYIVKPFKVRDLHSAVEVALNKHQMEEALRQSHDALEQRTAELQKANAWLQQELSERKQIEQQKASLEQVRHALWHMSSSQDIHQVLQALYHELSILFSALDACSVQVVDKDKGDEVSYQISDRRVHEAYTGSVAGTPVEVCWGEQRPVYRPDLSQDDPYGEAGFLWDEQIGYTAAVRSVLDVPFQQGTLAVNSTEPDAFSQKDIEILQEMAQILTEGFARFEDLRILEQRNRELEDEIVKRQQVEESLREREEHYRTLIERLPIGVVANKPDGSMPVFYNSKAREILGLDEEDLPQRTPGDAYVDLQDREELITHLQNDGFHEYEYWLKRKDGTPVLVRGISVAIYDTQGQPIRYEGYMEDITARRRRETQQLSLAQLRNEVHQMQSADDVEIVMQSVRNSLESLEIPFQDWGINVVDTSTDLLTVCFHNMTREKGWQVGEMEHEGKDLIVKVWQEGVPFYRRDLEVEDTYQERAHIQEGFDNIPRSVIDVPFSHGTLGVNSTEPDAFSEQDMASMQEITQALSEGFQRMEDLRALEQRNRELEREITERERFRTLLDRAGVAIYIADAEDRGRFVDFNETAYRQLGYSPEELLAMHPHDLEVEFPLHTPEQWRAHIAAMKAAEGPLLLEGVHRRKDGSTFPVEVIITHMPFLDRDYTLAMVRNMTERKQAEEGRQQLQRSLIQSERMATVGIVAAGIVHNLRGPLTSILGYGQLLRKEYPDSPDFEPIISSGQQMSQMIEDILAKSRQKKSQEPTDLNTLLQRELDFLQANLFFKHEVEKDIRLDEKLPRVECVYTDFSQAFGNLLRNAVDAMYQRETKRLSVVTSSTGKHIVVEVIDTGCGIPEANIPRLFEPFFTTKPSDGEEGEPVGTGLGLYTVEKLLERHGADIEVESVVDVGTTFRVKFSFDGEE